MKRRIVSVLLALVMCLSLVPTVAFAGEHDGQVRVIVENTTYPVSKGAAWDGILVNELVDLTHDSTAMSCVVAALTAKGYTQEGADSGYISEINGLSAGDGGDMSGWMGTLNDWFTNEGFGAFTVKNRKLSAGDEIRLMYSLDYGEDCGGSWNNNDKTVKDVAFSAGILDKAFDKNTHDYTLTVPADTTAVTVTPTASNKNYQVRTFVGETEYKRTAAIPVTEGTVITVKCGDPAWPSMNTTTDEARVYTFTVNRPLPAESISLNTKELTLNKSDKETLTATVTPDGATDEVTWSSSAEAVATVTNGVVTAVSAGTATITATAGTESDTCEVTVTDWKTVTVNVAPKTVNVTFYSDAAGTKAVSTDMVKDNGEKKVGNVTYHQYTLLLPDDLKDGGVYSYRGTEGAVSLGGEEFKPADYLTAPLHLLRANVRYNAASLNQEGDYTFTLKNGEKEVVYGTPYVSSNIRYTPTLLIAGVEHSGTAALAQQWQEDYYLSSAGAFTTTPSKTASSASNVNLPITAYKIIRVTAPKEATTTFYKQDANYVVESVAPDSSAENEDGTVTYMFKGTAAHSNYQFRSMLEGKVTQAGYLADGNSVTVSFPDRSPAGTASSLNYDDNSVLLNINEKNKLNLAVGDTFKLRAFRAAWEIVNNTSANQMIEPDFHFAVLSGEGVVSITPTTESANTQYPNANSGNATGNWMNVTALQNGTAVVAVWYDAIDVYNANPPAANAFSTFGATDPARYGIFVVTVGENNELNWNPVSQDGDWDSEFDTVYYVGDEGGTFSFASDDAASVTVTNLCGATMGSAKTVTKTDDKWNVPVYNGSNLITITSASGTDYRLVRAKKVNAIITNITTGKKSTDEGFAITVGDTVSVSLDKLDMPLPKMSGIYNPGVGGTCKMVYQIDGKYTQVSKGTQYDFPTPALCTVTFVASQAGDIHLGNGYITTGVFGSAPGAHRGLTDAGKPVNTNAPEASYCFGKLPELTLHVEDGALNYADMTELSSFNLHVGMFNGMSTAKYVEFKTAADAVGVWNSNTNTNAYLSITVTPKTYYNTMKLTYWYDGQSATTVDVPANNELRIPVGDQWSVHPDKILNLVFTITPGDGNTAEAKSYTFVVMSTTDQNAITKAVNAINAIGTVTADSGAKITAARSTYDALKDVLKAKVTNYAVLTDAESAYANIVRTKANDIYEAVGDSLLENAKESTPIVGSTGGEWMILGLARSDKLTSAVTNAYDAKVTSYIKANINADERLSATKSTENSRLIIALSAIDKDPTKVGGHDLTRGLNSMSYLKRQGTNGPVWALIALDSHNYAESGEVTREKLIDTICSAQMESGGWYISDAKREEDVDMTAMAVQALAPYYKKSPDANSAVNKALDWLDSKQGKDGDFGTSESNAQVIVALCALGIDPASDRQFTKRGYSALSAMCSYYTDVASKGFKHTKDGDYNQMATEQCYYALVAYDRFKSGKTALYDMSDVHQMTKTAAKAATCTAEGNNEYWFCSRCNKYFKDEAGTTVTTVAAETLTKLGHDFTKKVINEDHLVFGGGATCQHAAIYYYDCSRCEQKSDTETFAYGSTTAHNYGQDGKCPVCGAVNPMKDVKTDSIAAATEVGGKTVKPEEGKQIVADYSGLAVKTDSGVALNDVKAAVAAGRTKVTIDEKINTTITTTEADKTGITAVEALKEISGVTNEQKAELDKIVVELESYNANAAKPNTKVEQVVDISLELVKVDGSKTLGEIKELAQPVTVSVPASKSLQNALQNKNKVVKAIITHTEVDGTVTVTEADVEFNEETGEAVIVMNKFSTVAFVTYDKVGGGSHSSGSSTPSGARTITTDLPVGSINAVFVNGKKLDSKYYVINGSSVTLTEAYMSTLKAGRYTIRIENATHMSTATIEVAADGVLSARTGDAGVVLYIAMCAMSCIGSTALLCKRKEEA